MTSIDVDDVEIKDALKALAKSSNLMHKLWSKEDIADYMGFSTRFISSNLDRWKTFPVPIRFETDRGFSNPRWVAKEVIAWAEKNKHRYA